MSRPDKPLTIADDVVVTLDYTLTVDGEVVDSAEESGAIEFIQGAKQIIAGLERQLYGMRAGESKHLVVQPAEGYGETEEDGFAEVPRSDFPEEIPLEQGIALQLRTDEDEVYNAYIDTWDDDTVRLSLTHPLAGKELHFAVTVLELRSASQEELAHGHVHAHGDED